MRWKKGRKSANVDDRRTSSGRSGGGFKMPSMQTLFFIFPLVKPLLKSKLGLFVVGAGALAWMSGFNPLSFMSGGQTTNIAPKHQAADDQRAAFISTVLADTEDVWKKLFNKAGYNYKEPKMVLYRGATDSGCGGADAAMGPFYCPADETIYIDLGFFDELKHKFKASGDFAQAYILSHEVGHHIQNLQGTLEKVTRAKQRSHGKSGANALQVKVELQADCYAGIWAHHAHKMKNILEEGDIDEALNAANVIGDDTLQKKAQGYVVPDSFTHGSSKQRMTWFLRGLESGDLNSCNTF